MVATSCTEKRPAPVSCTVFAEPAVGFFPSQSTQDKSNVASTALWGAVGGQLFFGGLADLIGRRIIFISTLALICVGALGSCLCFETNTFSIYQQLAFWRFILGLGVGGEYPLAASIAAENSSPQVRGRAMAAVFSMQGMGQLLAAGLVNILLAAGASYEFTWRFCLGFGAFPAIVMSYFRVKMHESEDFKAAKGSRVSHLKNLKAAFTVWWRQILGTASTWFLLDISFYGNGLFNTTITKMMGLGSTVEASALSSLYVTLMAIPGYYFSVALLDKIGRWNLQMGGFTMLVILFVILSSAFYELQQVPGLFIVLYGMTYFFSNFGPNTTTYVIPGEYFPSQVKATCHGISAAAGKVGAAIAGWVFPPLLSSSIGIKGVLYICAGVSLGGIVCTFLVPRYTADELEDIKKAQLLRFKTIVGTAGGRDAITSYEIPRSGDELETAI